MRSHFSGLSGVLRLSALFLMAGSYVNDLVLFEGVTPLSLAKILFISGVGLLLLAGLPWRPLARLDWALLIYVVGLLFVSIFSKGRYGSEYAISIAASLLIGLVAHFSVAFLRWDELRRFLIFFVVWMLLSSALGFFQALTGGGYVADRSFQSIVVPGVWRSSGLSSDPNYFALMCLIAFAIMRSIFPGVRGSAVVVFVFGLSIVLSGSRAGIIVFAVAFLWSAMSGLGFGKSLKAALFLLALLVGLLFVSQNSAIALVFDPRNYTMEGDRSSLQDRAQLLLVALQLGFENPIFGVGLGGLRSDPMNLFGSVSHNTYAEVFSESGVLGLLLLFIVYRVVFDALSTVRLKRGAMSIEWLVWSFLLMGLTLVLGSSRLLFLLTGIASGAAASYQLKYDPD